METFRPGADTILINAATGTPGGATAIPTPSAGSVAYRVFNQGSRDAWVGFGATSDAAIAASVIPVIGAGSKAQSIPQGQILHLIMAPQTFVAARATMESSNIYITPGHIVPANP